MGAFGQGDPVRSNDRGGRAVGNAVFTSLLLAAQVLLAIAAVALIPFQAMRTAVCDTQCDFATASAAMTGVAVSVTAILVLTVVVLIVRRKNWAKNWPILLGGIALTALAMFVCNQIFIAALPEIG
jgi:hypothetical protein